MKLDEFYERNIELFRKNKDFEFMFERGIERLKSHWFMPLCKAKQIISNSQERPHVDREECYRKITATLEEYMEYALDVFLPIARKENPNIDLTYGRLVIAVLYHKLPLNYFLEDLSKTKTYQPLLTTAEEAIRHFLQYDEKKNEDIKTLGQSIGNALIKIHKTFEAPKKLKPEEINRKELEKEVRENKPGQESLKLGLVKKDIFLVEIAQEILELLQITKTTEVAERKHYHSR